MRPPLPPAASRAAEETAHRPPACPPPKPGPPARKPGPPPRKPGACGPSPRPRNSCGRPRMRRSSSPGIEAEMPVLPASRNELAALAAFSSTGPASPAGIAVEAAPSAKRTVPSAEPPLASGRLPSTPWLPRRAWSCPSGVGRFSGPAEVPPPRPGLTRLAVPPAFGRSMTSATFTASDFPAVTGTG